MVVCFANTGLAVVKVGVRSRGGGSGRDAIGVKDGERVSPDTLPIQLEGLGSVVSSPPGSRPAENAFYLS